MRFDHFHGLNKAGRSLVSRRLGCHQIVMRVWPDGRSETIESDSIPLVEKVEVLGQVRGFYRRSIGLRQRYHLVGGRVLDEFLQLGCKNNHWHSGPHYGLALREQDGSAVEQSLWTDEKMEPPALYIEGLNPWARNLLLSTLAVHDRVRRTWSFGRVQEFSRYEVPALKAVEELEELVDPTDERRTGYRLKRYIFEDGRVFDECLQRVVCYGGDHYYLALSADGQVMRQSLWHNRSMY